MANRVGSKGQVVIEQRIREALGIEPGALAFQKLAGDRVEIQFGPAPHTESLRGVLKPFVRHWPEDPDDPEATEAAWVADWVDGGTEETGSAKA